MDSIVRMYVHTVYTCMHAYISKKTEFADDARSAPLRSFVNKISLLSRKATDIHACIEYGFQRHKQSDGMTAQSAETAFKRAKRGRHVRQDGD